MSIGTYADLQTALTNWLHRTDLASRIPEFIQLAEALFNEEIRTSEMETRVTTSASEYTTLPASDILELRNVQLNTTPITLLEYASPDALDRLTPSGVTGRPRYFSMVGNTIQLGPPPDGTYTLEIDYYANIPALTASNTTNWLLTAHPGVYLYASLMEAEPFLGNDPRIATWAGRLDRALAGLRRLDERKRHGIAPMVRVA